MPPSRGMLYRLQMHRTRLSHRLGGRKTAHFLHIRKTGGTAVKAAFAPHAISGHFGILLHPHDVTLRHIPQKDGVFFFLRDPLSRFVSGFYSRQRQGKPRYYRPWSPQEAQAFSRFDSPNALGLALASRNADERAEAEQAMRDIRHVNSSYWDWFESEAYLRSRQADVFFVGTQERLNADFDCLRQKLGFPALELPTDEMRAHRSPPSLNRALDAAAAAALREWYAEDYRFVRLCQELFGVYVQD